MEEEESEVNTEDILRRVPVEEGKPRVHHVKLCPHCGEFALWSFSSPNEDGDKDEIVEETQNLYEPVLCEECMAFLRSNGAVFHWASRMMRIHEKKYHGRT
jgi:hypothetical protein